MYIPVLVPRHSLADFLEAKERVGKVGRVGREARMMDGEGGMDGKGGKKRRRLLLFAKF